MPNMITKKTGNFWNILDKQDTAEVYFYGDIVDNATGTCLYDENNPNLFITPNLILKDIEKLKTKKEIKFYINSDGGDVFTAVSIVNELKRLPGKKVGIINGLAASAASVICCAMDEVQVYTSSLMMIHGAKTFPCDAIGRDDLKKFEQIFDKAEMAIREIYCAKTGKTADEINALMYPPTGETWYTGQEIIDAGFADTLIEAPAVEFNASDLRINNKIVAKRQKGKNLMAKTKLKNARIVKMMMQRIKLENPNFEETDDVAKELDEEVTEEIEKAVEEKVEEVLEEKVKEEVDKAVEEAVAEEQNRIKEIEEIENTIANKKLVYDAKYGEKVMNARDLAYNAKVIEAKTNANVYQQIINDGNKTEKAVNVNSAFLDKNMSESEKKVSRIVNLVKSRKAVK